MCPAAQRAQRTVRWTTQHNVVGAARRGQKQYTAGHAHYCRDDILKAQVEGASFFRGGAWRRLYAICHTPRTACRRRRRRRGARQSPATGAGNKCSSESAGRVGNPPARQRRRCLPCRAGPLWESQPSCIATANRHSTRRSAHHLARRSHRRRQSARPGLHRPSHSKGTRRGSKVCHPAQCVPCAAGWPRRRPVGHHSASESAPEAGTAPHGTAPGTPGTPPEAPQPHSPNASQSRRGSAAAAAFPSFSLFLSSVGDPRWPGPRAAH